MLSPHSESFGSRCISRNVCVYLADLVYTWTYYTESSWPFFPLTDSRFLCLFSVVLLSGVTSTEAVNWNYSSARSAVRMDKVWQESIAAWLPDGNPIFASSLSCLPIWVCCLRRHFWEWHSVLSVFALSVCWENSSLLAAIVEMSRSYMLPLNKLLPELGA